MLFHRESENGPGRKRSLKVILPKFPFAEGCLDSFWVSPRMRTTQTPWLTCASAWSPFQVKKCSWCWDGTHCVSVCAHCLLYHHWAPLERTCICHFYTLPSGIYTHLWVRPEPSLLQAKQTQLFQPFLTQEMIQAFDHVHSPSLDLSSTSTSPRTLEPWTTQELRCELNSAEQRGRIATLNLLAVLSLKHSGAPCIYFMARASYWLLFSHLSE